MKIKKICALAALSLSFSAGVSAQSTHDEEPRLFAAITNADHPNARGQWTKEQCDAWAEKYGPIIGINCPSPPCAAITQEEAIKLASELGFNSVRWWPGGWTANEYINSVEQWAAWADKYGMTVAPVFGFPQGYYNRADKEQALAELEGMVRQVIRHFRNDDRIVLWDIWNEPEMTDPEICKEQMEWIQQMVLWCREEGCTQPISSSIIWDSGIGSANPNDLTAIRNETEGMMDLHNFHNYSVQEDHNRNVSVMVNRIGKINDNALVCTECLTRTNGSGVARTLTEFSKYGIHFYTWGLYSCDANWEVSWGRSTYYAWEPMFHNLLYADGEPYNPAELDFIKNFKFASPGERTDPGAEYTERWTERRAWKWMSGGPLKGLSAGSVGEAQTLISQHATDGLYNTISVRLKYTDYGSSSFYTTFDNLLAQAKEAGMTVLPVLLTDDDLPGGDVLLATSVYNFISKYYNDARIEGWNLFTQTSTGSDSKLATFIPYLFRYVRYAFPNQPMFAVPLVSNATTPDAEGGDVPNLFWQLSDVAAYNMAQGSQAGDAFLGALYKEYKRPAFCMNAMSLQDEFATYHVNWYAAGELNADDVAAFAFKPIAAPYENYTGRMEGWQAYAQMNRVPTKGLSYNSVSAAITGVTEKASSGLYNSVQVQLDFDTYFRNSEKFFEDFNNLLELAGNAGMTVLPALMNDKYALRNQDALVAYVADMIGRYDKDARIMAWDVYYKPCTQSVDRGRVAELLPLLFSAAREAFATKPVFATPTVSTTAFPADFDYIDQLVHGGSEAGWNRLEYANSSVEMCYDIWCMSDVIAYASSQDAPELGWLNSVAYRFGRPLFCTKWQPSRTEDPSAVLSVFRNMHVNWYVDGEPGDENVSSFAFDPIITDH